MIITNSKDDLRVSESIEVMNKIFVSIRSNKDRLEEHIKAVNSGLIVQDISYTKLYSEVLNEYTKIIEILAPISKHSKISICDEEVLENIKIKTLKGIVVGDITIDRLVPVDDIIPSFNINITNLGLIGIGFTDTISVTLINDESREKTNVTFPSPVYLNKINESGTIEVTGLVAINKEAVCDLVIEFFDKDNKIFLSHTLKGINVYARGEVNDSSEV